MADPRHGLDEAENRTQDGPAAGGFVSLIGLQLDELSSQRAAGSLVVEEKHLQPFGLVHGGVYAAIAETLASLGAAMAVRERHGDQTVVGLENHTSFLRAARAGERIVAEAVPRHAGRRVQQWAVTMRGTSDPRELATSTVRLLVVSPSEV